MIKVFRFKTAVSILSPCHTLLRSHGVGTAIWNFSESGGIAKKYIKIHYCDVIMKTIASQITSLTIVYLTVNSGTDHRKHQSSASLAFVRGIHRRPVNSPHKGPVTRKMFPCDDVIMIANNFTFSITWRCHGAHLGVLSFSCTPCSRREDATLVWQVLTFSTQWRIRHIPQVITFQFACVIYLFVEDRIEKLRKLPRATTNVQKNKSYVGLFISYVGLIKSYVGLYNSYAGDKIS